MRPSSKTSLMLASLDRFDDTSRFVDGISELLFETSAKIEDLDQHHPLARFAHDHFYESCSASEYRITAVKRIIHPLRQFQYNLQKKSMSSRNDGIVANEKLLFHGTHSQSMSKIIANGFNRSFSKREAYGSGIYFAQNALYSTD
eukprot:CAMPEP_0113527118 /NCGR_PEP_ID=MMETSP0015_2-20120614/1122_1 /TAXON_ID=2838 /ORGANISM="Odontella" /LENGTH=144 /DNA_ID=CAMNT_0000425525 /DNA_START=246 /DNA_END=680 /DNA_ORIENTATION=+ /assembly_acc=CAM_ASM_000160